MTAPLQYLLIIVNVVSLDKVCFSLRLFAKTLTVDEKHYLLNRDNLTQPIMMQLYQKQKILTEFFSCISKIYLNI